MMAMTTQREKKAVGSLFRFRGEPGGRSFILKGLKTRIIRLPIDGVLGWLCEAGLLKLILNDLLLGLY